VLRIFPAVSVETSSVTVGTDTVETTTVPGYANLVAVTSIWHRLLQETDGTADELDAGYIVWITVVVVGITSVMVSD
jgi:hypothetical protein